MSSANVWSPNSRTVTQANASGTLKHELAYLTKDQRTVDIESFAYVVNTGSLLVYKNGKILTRNKDYIEATTTQIILTEGAETSDQILFLGFVGITGTVVDDTVLRSDLLAGSGSKFVGFLPRGAGAVSRKLEDKVREVVSVTDHMSDAERADALTGNPVLDVTAAFNKALAESRNVHVPEGVYLISGFNINRNWVTLSGDGMYATRLIMTPVAKPAISIATLGGGTVASFITIKDLTITGNATNLGGIKLGTTTSAAAGFVLDDVFISGFTSAAAGAGYGVQLCSNQNTEFKNVWTERNNINIHRANGGYCTSTKWYGKKSYIGHAYSRGMLIDGQIDDLYLEDGVVEGNDKIAIEVTANAVLGDRGSRFWFKKLYFEANLNAGAVVGQPVISVIGGAGPYQEHRLSMDSCNFAADPNAPAGYKKLSVDHVIGRVHDTLIAPQDIKTTVDCVMRFDFNRHSSAADFLVGYRALLGNVSVTDFNTPSDGTQAEQLNIVSSIQFPAVARKISDPTTLDDYREGIWTPVLSSDGIAPTYTNVDAAEGTYTKIGNLVFCRGKIRANITAVGTGTPRITGFPYVPKGLEPATFGLATALTTIPTESYVLTGKVLVINSTYKITADGYLIFTITYQTSEA